VVAAALRAQAHAIVSTNVRDYPVDILGPLNIEVIHPDNFLLDQLASLRESCSTSYESKPAHTRQPALTPVDLLARLARAGVPGFADEAGRLI
jgi:hypothetical protein